MSANPTRVDWAAHHPGSPLQEGNLVLESIASRQALRALRSFSDFHEQVRNRRAFAQNGSDSDLLDAEHFILDEVLQLICDRAQTLTQADGIVVALAKGSVMVCRAAAGSLAIERGIPLTAESELLQECLSSGSIVCSDDCGTDTRAKLDTARMIGARSTVLVPLRGRHQQLGVLQVFSATVSAFSDDDRRCFELFAELLLSSLKPEDEDRRINWLSDVASDVLKANPLAPEPVVTEAAAISTSEIECNSEAAPERAPASLSTSSLEMEAQPGVNPAAMVELFEPEVADDPLEDEIFEVEAWETPTEPRSLPFLQRLSLLGSSRPGLSVVMGLLAVAALFSAGAWWGMQLHGKAATPGVVATNAGNPPRSVTTPSAPAEIDLSLGASDNLMNPGKPDSDAPPLAAVADNKLAALPKVTGVRHWASTTGSTVVIDMDDQVPYEVHRLMSPERIYFDLHDTVLSHELDGKTINVGDASLSRVRIAQPVAGVTRVVLDTQGGSNFSVSMESSPYRLVVELRGKEKTNDKVLAANSAVPDRAFPKKSIQTSASASTSTSVSASVIVPPSPVKVIPAAPLQAKASDQAVPAKTGKFRIVLDAGHGGWDLGTVGRQGLLEKDLVLDVAQRLGKLLKTRLGSEVMFTRTSDTYLPLEQRADFANQLQADLFVSVHANYSSSATARGVETYYTNLFSAPGTREVESHDDGTFAKPTPVSLSPAGLHEKIEESRRLAASVQHSLYGTLAAKSPDIRNRGIKDAAFAVLTGTTMPSILTEISFVSSPADEHSLQNATYRQQIAEALYKGIARYQETSPHAKIAQLQTPASRR